MPVGEAVALSPAAGKCLKPHQRLKFAGRSFSERRVMAWQTPAPGRWSNRKPPSFNTPILHGIRKAA